MRWLPGLLALSLGCTPPLPPLVFEVPGGERARDATFDFGPRGGPVSRTQLLLNTGEAEVTLGEPAFESEAAPEGAAVAETLLRHLGLLPPRSPPATGPAAPQLALPL